MSQQGVMTYLEVPCSCLPMLDRRAPDVSFVFSVERPQQSLSRAVIVVDGCSEVLFPAPRASLDLFPRESMGRGPVDLEHIGRYKSKKRKGLGAC